MIERKTFCFSFCLRHESHARMRKVSRSLPPLFWLPTMNPYVLPNAL